MFYAFTHTVNKTDAGYTYPYNLKLDLTAGVIHQVDVLFQDGCDHSVYAQIWQADFQLWPSNRGSWLRGNATIVSFRDFFELPPGLSNLTARIWTPDAVTVVDKDVIIQIGLLPKKVLQPLSFEELLAAATGVE